MIFAGVIANWAMTGVVSVTATPSATQLAVAPWEVIPSHTLLVPSSFLARFRCGEATPAFTSVIVGSSCSGRAKAPAAPDVSANAARTA